MWCVKQVTSFIRPTLQQHVTIIIYIEAFCVSSSSALFRNAINPWHYQPARCALVEQRTRAVFLFLISLFYHYFHHGAAAAVELNRELLHERSQPPYLPLSPSLSLSLHPAVRIQLNNFSSFFPSCCALLLTEIPLHSNKNDRDGNQDSLRWQSSEWRCPDGDIDGGGCFWRHLQREGRSQTAEVAGVEKYHTDGPPTFRCALWTGCHSLRIDVNSCME